MKLRSLFEHFPEVSEISVLPIFPPEFCDEAVEIPNCFVLRVKSTKESCPYIWMSVALSEDGDHWSWTPEGVEWAKEIQAKRMSKKENE